MNVFILPYAGIYLWRICVARGGARPGSGPKPGYKKTMTELSRIEAKLEGILPHEWLLKVVRGDPILQRYVVDVVDKQGAVIGQEVHEKEVYPDIAMRHDAAKAAAPYYAPRLATQVITLRGREDVINSLTDEQLDAAIEQLAGSPEVKKATTKTKKAKVLDGND